jgi:hypothetical protein
MKGATDAERKRDPDLAQVEAALRRAGQRARERARRASGYVVLYRDGRVVEEKAGDR